MNLLKYKRKKDQKVRRDAVLWAIREVLLLETYSDKGFDIIFEMGRKINEEGE